MEFRNHLKDNHPDIENPDLAYLHAGNVLLKEIESVSQMSPYHQGYTNAPWQLAWHPSVPPTLVRSAPFTASEMSVPRKQKHKKKDF